MTFAEIDSIDAVLEPYDWPVPRLHGPAIAANWDKALAGGAKLFNGTVLIQHRGALEGRVFRAGYSPVEYRDFLGWMRLGLSSPGVRNGFGMAALRARDGAFLLGEMGPTTANAGKVYFAAGTPDMGDVRDGKVDLAGSVLREMEEETGLKASEVTVSAVWTAVIMETRVAFMRAVQVDLPAEEARKLMLDRMTRLHEEELSDIVIVRPDDRQFLADGAADQARMPPFVAEYIRRSFAAG